MRKAKFRIIGGDSKNRSNTGIYDSKKELIREGDIVSIPHLYALKSEGKRSYGVVVWMNGRSGFYVLFNSVGTDIVNRSPFKSAYKMKAFKYTIEGNIIDNKDLVIKYELNIPVL